MSVTCCTRNIFEAKAKINPPYRQTNYTSRETKTSTVHVR